MNCLSMFRVATVVAATLPALSLPATAFAQASSPAPSPAAGTPASPALPAAVASKVEQHIKELHDQLGVTPAEQPQWDQFADVMRGNAAQMNEVFANRAGKVTSMSAADNMQSYAQVAQVHATNMQKLASAFQSLYNTFPDEQKQVADGVFRNNNGKPLPHKH
jgi:periplasmic protein CpxP/Spy